jgi:putative hydroxymethylpyrimidine transport system ATP-binding protein
MLAFEHVTYQYDSKDSPIIEDLSFSVETGDFVSLIGVSGCGKSTIFKLINGILPLGSGTIQLENASGIPAGYMPQKDLLFPWRTIEKNISLPLELREIPAAEQKEQAARVLEEIGMTEYAQKYPKDLSGGMRQRVSFARTLLTGAPLLLLDEPFSALDALTRMSMQEWLLSEWSRYEKTVLFITHDVEEAIFMSKKILLVEDKPIRSLKSIDVPLPYPRKREYMARPEIIALRDELVNMLRKQVKI